MFSQCTSYDLVLWNNKCETGSTMSTSPGSYEAHLLYDGRQPAESQPMFILPCDDSAAQLHDQSPGVLELIPVSEGGSPPLWRQSSVLRLTVWLQQRKVSLLDSLLTVYLLVWVLWPAHFPLILQRSVLLLCHNPRRLFTYNINFFGQYS